MTKTPTKAARRRSSKPLGDYEVGYCKPPEHSQFRKGQRPNPKGRPKNQPTVHDQVTAVLQRKIPVTEHGATRMITVQEAMLLAVGQKAVRGDLKSIAFLFNLREATRDTTATTIDPTALAAFDQATLHRYIEDALARDANDPAAAEPVVAVSDASAPTPSTGNQEA
jgi:hypothetical protein